MTAPDHALPETLHEPGEEYRGAAEILDDEHVDGVPVQVHLRGHFEPIDGRFHWYGRIEASGALADRHRSGATIVLHTPNGIAAGRIADVDPWGRFRVTGLGAPPF